MILMVTATNYADSRELSIVTRMVDLCQALDSYQHIEFSDDFVSDFESQALVFKKSQCFIA